MDYQRKFERPIEWRGRTFATLQDAADYMLTLPLAEQRERLWEQAARDLMRAAQHGGPFLFFANSAMLKALNPEPLKRERKPTWQELRKIRKARGG